MTNWRGGLATALAIVAVGVVAAAMLRPPLPVDETRYLTVAWEMWSRGDYLVPHLNGAPYSHKPPLLFWTINAAWALFGVSETVARLAVGLYGLAAVALTSLLARRLWPSRPEIGDCAALVMAGCALIAVMATLVMFDMALTVAVLLAMLGLVDLRQGRFTGGWLLFGVGTGIGVLAKGPVVLVHVLPAALLAPLWWRDAGRPRWGRHALGLAGGLAVAAAIGLAWALPAAGYGGPEYRNAIFWGQSAGRVVDAFAHAQPWWLYLAILPMALFPWVLWPPVWQGLARLRGERDDGLRLLATWALSTVLLLSLISGKQPHYLVPVVPAFAILIARALSAVGPAAAVERSWLPGVVPVAAGIGVVGLELWIAAGHPTTQALTTLPFWLGAAILAVAGLYILASRSDARRFALALLAPGLFLLVEFAGQRSIQAYDLHPTAEVLKRHERSGVAMLGNYSGEFTFLGRLERPVRELANTAAAEAWAAENPGGVIVAMKRDRQPPPDLPEIFSQFYRTGPLAVWQAPGGTAAD